MPQLIEIESEEDCIKVVGILSEEDESYSSNAPNLFLITKRAVRLLRTKGVRFRIWGEPEKKENINKVNDDRKAESNE